MGRNTYLSLPKGALPNRRNVVLSTTVSELPGCDVYPTLDAALQSCSPDEDIYIIGGARVYEQAISMADRLCLTEVDDTPAQADAFFPDYSDWQVVNKETHPKDERHAFEYAFTDYERTR
jgi:dihydrofolate reductase